MTLSQHIRAIETRWPALRSTSNEQPVFVLAAGWRSGSTLLQRMLMRQCFIWGEPFGRAMPIDAMAQPLKVFSDGWPSNSVFADSDRLVTADLSKEWVANLYPPMESLLQAHVGFFTTLLQLPAARLGYRRWGLKEVRLSADHAAYLLWLFPRAKLLFLYRDPYDCYRSFLSLKVTCAPNRSGESIGSLGQRTCAARVGASQKLPVSRDEWQRLKESVEPIASQLGYQCPTD